jgi:electron transfer flavoprotein beta subunit
MRIIVPIKQVPETSNVKMDPVTGTMIRTGVEAIVNPLDLYALEAALRLREQHGGTITTISMGPAVAEKALREGIAMGCDDAVLLTDREFAGSDTWATAYALSECIRRLGEYSLIVCGERATDGDTGQVGPSIAAFLDLPVATYVSRVHEVTADEIRVERLVEGGTETVWCELPAVLTVVKDVAYPRLPTLAGKRRARQAQVATLGASDVGVRREWIGLKGSPTRVVRIARPQVSRDPEMIRVKEAVDVDWAAERLVGFLRERHLLR